jgi:hypothetical protein
MNYVRRMGIHPSLTWEMPIRYAGITVQPAFGLSLSMIGIKPVEIRGYPATTGSGRGRLAGI